MSDLHDKLEANRQKAMSDWSQLNHQVVGGEVFPMADHEKIELLKTEVVKLREQVKVSDRALTAAKEALSIMRLRSINTKYDNDLVDNALARIAECEKETT